MTTTQPLRPLVVGSPRSGFALLCSVMSNLAPLRPTKLDLRQTILNAFIDAFGDIVAREVSAVFEERGMADNLIYNANFRKLCGGPKWLGARETEEACYRKYIGVRGLGDFTLITTHPVATLDYDEILHSHVDPVRWAEEPSFAENTLFASMRNPIGIINSSLFSLNALTSEYIQRFVPPEDDNDEMRQNLALYKYTDLRFFEGLVRYYRDYFEEFVSVREKYIVMRWEDLISKPAETICRLAEEAGITLDDDSAGQIWARLDHVNLTGAHKHNYRQGKGRVGDWRNWITNRHLDIIRDYGFDEFMTAFGYDPVPRLDEAKYSPFQKRVDSLLASGTIYNEFEDRELFGFAFNKSNIDSSEFGFKRYEWREHTQVERADFRDENLMIEAWTAADQATGHLNTVLDIHLSGSFETLASAITSLERTQSAANYFRDAMPRAYEAIFPNMRELIIGYFSASDQDQKASPAPPLLICSRGSYNVVAYGAKYFGIPQSAGPMDLSTVSLDGAEGIVVRPQFESLIDSLSKIVSRN